MWAAGSKGASLGSGFRTRQAWRYSIGFTLVELLIVFAVIGLVLALAVSRSSGFYENIQRREAIREVRSLFLYAREAALSSGQARDVRVNPGSRKISTGDRHIQLPESLSLTVHGAAELNADNVGVIRFYPDGSASGGGVDIATKRGPQSRITVDWLLGRVELEQGEPG